MLASTVADEGLGGILHIEPMKFCVYGDSGYNNRAFLEIPFQGSNLSTHQRAFKSPMASAGGTVEWLYNEIKINWTTVDFKRKLKVK